MQCDSDTFGAIAGGVAEEFYGGFGEVDAEGILKEYLDEELLVLLGSIGDKMQKTSSNI